MSTAKIGFEQELWQAATKLRGTMPPAQYKDITLGLIFLKYISDKFEIRYNELVAEGEGFEEDRDEYMLQQTFWVPQNARWSYIKENAKKPEIGQIIDDAMIVIEKENESLRGVLEKRYAREEVNKERLGQLVDVISRIEMYGCDEMDILGRVYEYFIDRFADSEGKKGGEYYTPTSIVKTLVNMIEPYKGKIYDPACGSGGMFVQSAKFVKEHQGNALKDLAIYGQEMNSATWKLCKMNLAIRGLEADLGGTFSDTFGNDLHKSLKADYILANPPFNVDDWGQENLTKDPRWDFGIPPKGNANYAWLQHMYHHLAVGGTAGIVLANGAASGSGEEAKIRQAMIESGAVECIVSMPDKLFYSVPLSVTLWILKKSRNRSDILFIDARKLGNLVDRKHKDLSEEEILKIANTYHNWRDNKDYKDVDGFCKSALLGEIKSHDYVLTPSRYVGIEKEEDDVIPFEEKMDRLTSELSDLFEESKSLEEKIKENLWGIGYEL